MPPGDIFEIGQALDAAVFQEPWTGATPGLPPGFRHFRTVLLVHGTIIPFKGIDRLLEAWIRFTQQSASRQLCSWSATARCGPASKGIGPRRVAKRGLSRLRSAATNAEDLPAADFYVLPSLEDCWSLAVEEAMAAGLPVIDSCYNGGSELIVEGENGWVADPLDVVDLAGKLSLAWEARDRREAMGDRARQAAERMSIENVVARLRAAVEEIVSREEQS